MEIFIIYAALSLNNLTSFVEFKGTSFQSLEKCQVFYKEHKNAIALSLQDHLLKQPEPTPTITHMGCSPKNVFLNTPKSGLNKETST